MDDLYEALRSEAGQVLLGTLLGDSVLTRPTSNSCALHMAHATKNEDYLLWKVQKIGSLGVSFGEPRRYLTKGKYWCTHIRSKRHPLLTAIRDFVYNADGKRVVSHRALDHVGTTAFVVWMLDDGCLNRRKAYYKLSMARYTFDEAVSVASAFNRMGLNPRAHLRCQRYPEITFSMKDTQIIAGMINRIVKDIPSMMYKAGERPHVTEAVS